MTAINADTSWSSRENLLDGTDQDEDKPGSATSHGENQENDVSTEDIRDNDSNISDTADGKIQSNSCISRLRSIVTVEPVLFLYFLAFIPTFPLSQQYVHQHFSLKYNLTDDHTSGGACSPNSTSDPLYKLEQQVQEETAQYMVYLNIALLLPSCVSVLFLGAYSDQAGRKMVLLTPMLTGVLRSLVFICVIHLHLDINYLMIGNIIDGFSGGCTSVIMSCFAYIADVTSKKRRSIRIYVLEFGISFGIAISQIYTGYMIESLGYVYPFLLSEAILVLNLFFVIFYIKDSIPNNSKKTVRILDFNHLKKTAYLFIENANSGRRWKLQLLVVIVLLNYMVDIGSGDIYTFYTLAPPFCFSPILIGYFNAAQYFIRVFGSMIFLKIFEDRLNDVSLMMIGTTSGIASQIIMAVAMTAALIFLSPVIGIFTSLVVPLSRSFCSKLVQADEQGAMSASVSLAQQISSLAGGVIFNSVYAQTVSIYRGIVFIVTGSVYGLSLLLMIFLYIRSRHEVRTNGHVQDLTTS